MLNGTIDRRKLLATGATAFGGLILLPQESRAQSKGLDKITLASVDGDDGLTIVELIKSQGFLKKYDLDPEFVTVSDGTKIISSMLGGSTDVCRASGFGQTLAAINQGAALKVIGGACVLIVQAIYTSRPEIKTLKDLEGRTVGAGAPGALIHHMTTALLRKRGVDVSKVTFQNIGSNAQVFKAVAAGIVDAGSGPINVYNEQEKYGVHSIADFWTELPEYPYQACYTSTKEIQQRRDVMVRALAGFQELYTWMQSDASRDDYVKASMKGIGETDPTKSLEQWTFFNKYKPFDIVLPPERIDYLQRLNIEAGIQKAMLPMDQIADLSLVDDALKLIGTPPKAR